MIDNPVRRVRNALNLSQLGMARKLRTTFLVLSDCEHSGTLPRNSETVEHLREAARQAGIDLQEEPKA